MAANAPELNLAAAHSGGGVRGCRWMVDHALRSAPEPEARTTLLQPKRRTRLVVRGRSPRGYLGTLRVLDVRVAASLPRCPRWGLLGMDSVAGHLLKPAAFDGRPGGTGQCLHRWLGQDRIRWRDSSAIRAGVLPVRWASRMCRARMLSPCACRDNRATPWVSVGQ